MKFFIALGLLFAGFAHSQQTDPIDAFLRQNQHLNSKAELVSIKQNGSLSTVTYKDGPMNMKYQVKNQNQQMKIVGIQTVVAFSNNMQFQPITLQDVPTQKLQPLPLIMPHWQIQSNGEVHSRNVFDQVEKEISEMEKKMNEEKQNIQNLMNQKRHQMQLRFRKNFDITLKDTPLLGADDHDYNEETNVQFDQPIIGGDHDYNWATENPNSDQPLIGGGDHDYNWATIEFKPNQPLLGGDDHDFRWEIVQDHPIIGGDDHDNWQQKRAQFGHPIIGGDDHDNWQVKRTEFDHPIVGGDDHDNWQQKKGKHCKHLKSENLIGRGGHDNWKHGKKGWKGKHFDKQQRHHSNLAWMNRQFSSEQITSYLNQKLPDIMNNAEIISIQNKGFQKGKGFSLQIQIKDKQGNIKNINSFYKPRKQEFLINKIVTVSKGEPQISIGDSSIESENLIAPNFIPQTQKPTLLGGNEDPDHEPDFLNIAKQIQFRQDNHIKPEHQQEESYTVPLLGGESDIDYRIDPNPMVGGQTDPDHNIQQVQLLGGQSDHDNIQQKIEQTQPAFDVSGLPLPGGETDIDHSLGLNLVDKVLKIAEEIFQEKIKDIDEDEVEQEKEQKLQLLIK